MLKSKHYLDPKQIAIKAFFGSNYFNRHPKAAVQIRTKNSHGLLSYEHLKFRKNIKFRIKSQKMQIFRQTCKVTPCLKGLDARNPMIVVLKVSGMVIFDKNAFKGFPTAKTEINSQKLSKSK